MTSQRGLAVRRAPGPANGSMERAGKTGITASTLADWLKEASEGEEGRLKFLCDTLQAVNQPPPHLRYQLFHRAASAVLEAQRFRAPFAVMMV